MVPGNVECVEKFPEYCLHNHQHHHQHHQQSRTTTPTPDSEHPRPLSISVQSTSSASDYSDNTSFSGFDSRRASIISSASSYLSVSSSPHQLHNQQQPLTRSRRDAKQLHAARLQRSGSASLTVGTKKDGSPNSKSKSRFGRSRTVGGSPQDALAATEPPHEQGLTRMAFAEQQRWITVQQKTFTKWLNTKLEARELEVKDLVKDLSDGVGSLSPFGLQSRPTWS